MDNIPGYKRPPLDVPLPSQMGSPKRVPSPDFFPPSNLRSDSSAMARSVGIASTRNVTLERSSYLQNMLQKMSKKRANIAGESYYCTPVKCINTQSDLTAWNKSEAFDTLMTFLMVINTSFIGVTRQIAVIESSKVLTIVQLIDQLDEWIQEIPPVEQPQRFGNVAFKQWLQRVTDKSEQMLEQLELPQDAIPELKEYWVHSFGNQTRLDYGSGHELNFFAFLTCLDLLSYFSLDDYPHVSFTIFNRYLHLVRKLQRVYKLEPAGSHGVWGLDDYQFIAYILGSAQLIDHPHLKAKSILNKDVVDSCKSEYMFMGCIAFIHEMKSGPFHEHSPYLYDVSGIKSGGWERVNRGLLKMFLGEVLGKFPIVQHFKFGSLLPWKDAIQCQDNTK
ncbi:hypothetical protein MIR68_007556 [Amoeboaphelidium protococcarum]|nr:hypothetical protein MIR68_007556 [Amoeboaphelidium protococcarum]